MVPNRQCAAPVGIVGFFVFGWGDVAEVAVGELDVLDQCTHPNVAYGGRFDDPGREKTLGICGCPKGWFTLGLVEAGLPPV